MRACTLAIVAAIGLGYAPCAKAEFWLDGNRSSSAALYGGAYHGGPYFVAGYGDDNYGGQRRYWGGPYFAACYGNNPPFETYRMSCRPAMVKVARRDHRSIRARLK
jgi:hypothetical protein